MTMFGDPQFWWWWVLAVFLLVLETLLPGTFFLWLAISAGLLGVLILLAPEVSVGLQLLIFSVLAVASVVLWLYVSRRRRAREVPGTLNRRGEQNVGRIVDIVEPIHNGFGRARVGDSLWSVEGPDMPLGARARVVASKGTRLVVEPAPADTIPGARAHPE